MVSPCCESIIKKNNVKIAVIVFTAQNTNYKINNNERQQ